MKIVRFETSAPRERVLEAIRNSNEVNRNVKFDDKLGRPLIKVKEKQGSSRIRVTCEMIGGPSKDNGFIVGTFFAGRLTEKNGRTCLSGILLTSPIYHILVAVFCIYFLVRSILLGGFTVMPIFVVGFTFVLFKDEYKKQGIIHRFFARAIRYAENQ